MIRGKQAKHVGFTLIELLLVLVILGVLAAVVVTKFAGRTEQAKVTAAKTDIEALGVALDAFEIDNGHYPTTEEGLRALVEKPSSAKAGVADSNWPYLKKGMPKDPWGKEYNYISPGANNKSTYDLSSGGPDGNAGGGDDVTNW